MKQSFFKSFLLAIISFAMVFITSCNSEETTSNSYIDPSFAVFVSSYTSGTISAHSSVLIRLAEEVSEEVFNTDLPDDLFSFSPEVKGEAVWLDKQTVEFRPAAILTPGSSYTVKFNLGKIIEVPEDKSSFEYSIKTLVQNFDLRVQNLITTDVKNMEILEMEGVITTADLAEVANVEKMLVPSQNGKSLTVSWDHASDGLSHRFVIKNITRKETEDVLSLNIKGEPIGSEKTDVLEVKIPALGDFKVVDSYVEQKGEQHIVIRFSDPLLTSQQLQGLVTVQGVSNLSFDIRNNEILIYPSVRQTGQKRITLYAGIKNILGSTFDKTTELDIYFEQIKPQVRFAGNGSILPGNEGTILPFEAVGLKAIDVTVIRIFEENISQFYQVNQIDGNREIQRVGRPVLKKVIRLDEGLTDLTRWSRYSLDLSELIKIEPGAIYQVKIGFRKPHHNYYCQGEEPETDLDTMMPEDDSWDNIPEEDESSYWDYSEDYYYSDDYDWSERDNPCSDSYYGDRRSIKRNIFASNIGIIAKKGNSGSITVVSTDIISTSPLSGAKVEILDYQKRIIGESDTNGEGIANIPVTGQPFLVVVEYNDHKGYLRVDDGSALSMSNFDTQGQTVEKGIKGFIYGERGVWRPGDSLYFAFILEDKDNLLPEDHPVVFELTDPMGKLDKRLVNSSGVNGLYRFATTTDEKAPTGNWMAKVRVGGTAFSKSVKIETVKPNRLKINFENEKETITADDPRIKGDLKVNWLHGAPASYLNAEFDVNLIQRKTVFKGYEEFSFDDVAKQYNGEQFSLYKGKVDQNGDATINLKLQPKNNPPGALTAQVSGRVYEEGGDFSIKSFSIPFYSYDVYTGIKPPKGDKARGMLLTDTTQTIDVVTLDSKGNPVSANVTLSLYKVEWRWWWDNTSYGANYVANSMRNQIQRGSVETKNGKGKWSFEVNYPDWGRYYVKACNNSSGHCTGKIIYIDWPGWAGRAQRDNPGGASMLSFSTDKQDYSVGEKVRVDIPGSAAGRALISIENGRKVVSTHWLETTKGENQFFFEATPEMAPGIYVSVTIVQKHAQTLNDLPIRMYGVTPVKITDPNTHLNPVLSMKDVLEPGKKVDLKISEQSGKPMTYTVAVVDEGLLDLTNFHTPDPWSNFYKREALGVKSFDMYEYVMG
ncbi:MAG: MG2 domain-containing protein, partial [Cyclobacteriaceae bacterium]|nr:MG2 domain-containing protein [Cyclobacteriaceae bacterium]